MIVFLSRLPKSPRIRSEYVRTERACADDGEGIRRIVSPLNKASRFLGAGSTWPAPLHTTETSAPQIFCRLPTHRPDRRNSSESFVHRQTNCAQHSIRLQSDSDEGTPDAKTWTTVARKTGDRPGSRRTCPPAGKKAFSVVSLRPVLKSPTEAEFNHRRTEIK
jgi:hypothetical protein